MPPLSFLIYKGQLLMMYISLKIEALQSQKTAGLEFHLNSVSFDRPESVLNLFSCAHFFSR